MQNNLGVFAELNLGFEFASAKKLNQHIF